MNGSPQPTINVAASLVAILLLLSGPMRDDSLQTLLATQPLHRLVFRKNGSRLRWHHWLRDLTCVIPFELAWGLRMMLLPTLAILGTAKVLASAESAIDIVRRHSYSRSIERPLSARIDI